MNNSCIVATKNLLGFQHTDFSSEMAESGCTFVLRPLTTVHSNRDDLIRQKVFGRLRSFDRHMCQLGLQLSRSWSSNKGSFLKANFPPSLCLFNGFKGLGKTHSTGWLMLTLCSRQTEQDDFKVSEVNGKKHGNMEKQSCSTSESFTDESKSGDANPTKVNMSLRIIEEAEKIFEGAVQMISSVGELKVPLASEHSTSEHAGAVRTVVFWACAAVAFGTFIGFKDGSSKASEFFAGYLLEQSLSVDNLFVFILIFKYFQVPHMYQNRVLSYGIAGAIIFRASIIFLGAATLQRFEVVNLFLAGILLYSAFKLVAAEDEEEEDLSKNFIVKTCKNFIPVTSAYDGDRFVTLSDGARKATPLLLTLAVVELSDIAFAVDSIPAVFGVTRDAFIVFSSNMLAILGLRSLYILISRSMSGLEYLQPAVGVVLGFIGCKMIADFFGYHMPTEISLGFVGTILGTGILLSIATKSEDNR